jgi:hypothetical protein
MACRFIDGFTHMTAADAVTYGKWTSNSSTDYGSSDTHRRFTGVGQYFFRNLNTDQITKDFNSNEAEGVIGHAFKIMDSAVPQTLIALYDGGTVQCGLALNSSRQLFVFRQTPATAVLGTGTTVLNTNQWYYVEWKWKITDTIASGEMEVHLDDVIEINITSGDSKNSANAYATGMRLGGADGVGNTGLAGTYGTDLYWFDLTGSENNARTGPVRVQTLMPTGDGNSSQFTGSDGNSVNNSLLVDETTPNGDTDYVESSTLNHKDTYATADTVAATNTIHVVAVNHVAKKTDTDPREIVAVTRISGTDYEASANKVLSTGYLNHQSFFPLDPAAASVWTKSVVDAAEFGLKVDV